MIRLIGVGDNTVDTYIHMRMRFPGGNALNVAVLAKRYGHEAAYLGTLGNDERGEIILTALAAEGVDASHCKVLDGATSFSSVEVIDGDRVFGESNHGVGDQLVLDEEDLRYISTYDRVHTSVYSNLEGQLAALNKASRTLSFDLSQRCDTEYLNAVLPHSDIAFISLSDISFADQEALIKQMHAFGPRLIVATRGKHGSWVFDGQNMFHQDIFQVKAIDSLGAGDAFAARFLVEHLDGATIPEAMQRAAQSAAQNCTWYGAFGHGVSY